MRVVRFERIYDVCESEVKVAVRAGVKRVNAVVFDKQPHIPFDDSQLVIEIDRLGMPEARTNYRHDFPLFCRRIYRAGMVY